MQRSRFVPSGSADQGGKLFTAKKNVSRVNLITLLRTQAAYGLVPGTTYEVQTRAVGGSMGYSDWSDPVARMAM